jgi:hypothetical protein
MKLTLKTAVVTGLIVLTGLGGMAASTTPAEAGARTGTWRYYNPAAYRYGYGGRYWGYRHHNNGGAVAAGLIGGLAVGALAASAAYPSVDYGYPYGYAAPAGYYPADGYGYGPGCYTVRRRYVDAWGGVVIRQVRVCD